MLKEKNSKESNRSRSGGGIRTVYPRDIRENRSTDGYGQIFFKKLGKMRMFYPFSVFGRVSVEFQNF